jgi:hypothetical protein
MKKRHYKKLNKRLILFSKEINRSLPSFEELVTSMKRLSIAFKNMKVFFPKIEV